MKEKKPSILFVCTANRFRSSFAEAIFRRLLLEHGVGEEWDVSSAGTWAENGLGVIPAIEWFTEHFDLDLSSHRSRTIDKKIISRYDLVIVMEKGQKEALQLEYSNLSQKVYLLTEFSNEIIYDIPDPAINPEENFIDVAYEIWRLISDNFQRICQMAIALK